LKPIIPSKHAVRYHPDLVSPAVAAVLLMLAPDLKAIADRLRGTVETVEK
jgi:hypothetical protein